ncbi:MULTISPECIES: siderophore-interacting protein [Glutamicibacter]|uniref:Siderophore-interacting protein n=1 Tax=Glutamicibacter arilaitensis (strain DSM 16368 / CIP 108037 / IAM 15318 / JCM 13566 / NCIMB 14258 / Re117) TaxID=861360 RepID=A0ABP1TZL0_GLUAR|nr:MULTISPECIES: siderophore-interacting protein [Glutamicibacter]CBT74526.1 putative siderophore-interacting protein [Glutamicibacter arilaitensis Re117]HCH47669.1 siderophore-interacting protein [Glutamicibacter sp.]
MSKHHKYNKYGPQVTVSARDGITLDVIRQAEKAGAKAGHDVAKAMLYQSIGTGSALTGPQAEELLAAAERAGAAAALSAARKVLDKTVRTSFHGAGAEPAAPTAPLAPPAAVPTAFPTAVPAPAAQEAPPALPYAQTYEEPLAEYRPPISYHEAPRGKVTQHVLTITRVQRLSDQLVRIVASAPDLDGYRSNGALDEYVKVFVADPALGLVPPYDIKALRQRLPREQVPRSKSYTIRWVDPVVDELAIDFVVHGEPGTVGHWAGQVEPGAALVISPARSKHSVNLTAPYYVLAADEAGIPAISKVLEALPDTTEGVALLEVADEGAMFDVKHPAGVELRWLSRDGSPAGRSDALPYTMQTLQVPGHGLGVIAHAERTTIKNIGRICSGWNTDKRASHISSYWTLREGRLLR